jgi:hypothetical protein
MDNSKAARIAVDRHGDDEQFDPAVVLAYIQQLSIPGTRTGLPAFCMAARMCTLPILCLRAERVTRILTYR